MGRSHLVAHTALGAGALMALHRLASIEPQAGREGAEALLDRAAGWVGAGASWAWDWLLPHGGAWWWAVPALALFWLGSLLPDVDNPRSILGRRVGEVVPGPHRGITHTDWVLLVLLVASVPEPTRLVAFVWLGAWLHCELDAWSTAGRARFWPLGRWKLVTLGAGPGARPGVAVQRPRRPSYRVGQPSELVALGLCVALGAVMGLGAWAL